MLLQSHIAEKFACEIVKFVDNVGMTANIS